MLNLNSPTVQFMMKNTPQGFGNIPVYYGNQPTVTQTIVQQPETTFQTQYTPMYPSPKEMIMQNGQNTVYYPTTFMPRNVVGAYNPGYEMAFTGYSNPYMGFGSYDGFGYPNNQMLYMAPPPDEETRELLESAIFNGISYDEQVENESKLLKTISRIVSKNLNRSEEEARKCEEAFEKYERNFVIERDDPYRRKPIKPMHIALMVGDRVIADMNPDKVFIRVNNYRMNAAYVEEMKAREMYTNIQRINIQNQMYMNAPERKLDHMDLVDFFNKGVGMLIADSLNRELRMQSFRNVGRIYDHAKFRENLLRNNGILKTKDEMKVVDRFIRGSYGVMPDGRPTTPGLDPSVATSFSYDPVTGQYSVTAPNFIKDRMEMARNSFIESLDSN